MIEESVIRGREDRTDYKRENSNYTDISNSRIVNESLRDDSKILVSLKETLEKEDKEKNRLIV